MLFFSLLAVNAPALPPLVPCAAAGRSGRHGFCTSSAAGTGTSTATAAPTPIILRGSNYIRLGGDDGSLYHSTFDMCAVNCYNRTRFLAAFDAMQRNGYNINRVFLDARPGIGIGGNTTSTVPLDAAWVGRLAQYITDGAVRGIYTMVTMVRVPPNQYFKNFEQTHGGALGPEWGNSPWNKFLTLTGQEAFAEYGAQLSAELKKQLPSAAARNAVVISLQNEFFLNGNHHPFGPIRTGTVTLGDGITYDMTSAKDRQQAADANTNRWATRTRAEIKKHLPNTLVTVGVFTYNAVHKQGANGLILKGCNAPPTANRVTAGEHESTIAVMAPPVDCRFPARPLWLAQAGLDFLDVHIYQEDGSLSGLDANLRTEEWTMIQNKTPVMMGEFGCNSNWGVNATTCGPHVRELQMSSCKRGFVAWLFWTYDCEEQTGGWINMRDGNGAIDNVLAPRLNPDPCRTYSYEASYEVLP